MKRPKEKLPLGILTLTPRSELLSFWQANFWMATRSNSCKSSKFVGSRMTCRFDKWDQRYPACLIKSNHVRSLIESRPILTAPLDLLIYSILGIPCPSFTLMNTLLMAFLFKHYHIIALLYWQFNELRNSVTFF